MLHGAIDVLYVVFDMSIAFFCRGRGIDGDGTLRYGSCFVNGLGMSVSIWTDVIRGFVSCGGRSRDGAGSEKRALHDVCGRYQSFVRCLSVFGQFLLPGSSELLQVLVQRVDPSAAGKGDATVVDAILAVNTDRPSLKPLYRSALQVRAHGKAVDGLVGAEYIVVRGRTYLDIAVVFTGI